jgi:hypothetical protein
MLYAGKITSHVASKEILQGESVILTITIVGEEFDTLPNIPRIGGAKVLGSNRSMKTRILTVNGKAVMEQTSILMLEFRPTTALIIPAFQMMIDGELKSTEPIEINIVKTKPTSDEESKFLIEMNSTKEHIMVGEPLVVNVFFKQKTDVDVVSIDYKEPPFKAFFSKRIGTEKSYKDGSYTVQKLTYLLIAKEEGSLTITPARVKVAQRGGKNQSGGWFASTPTWSSTYSSALTIQAKNPLEHFDAIGIYRINESVDTQKIEANKPIHLKFTMEGEGSLEDFEGLSFNISGVTIYSDDAKIESQLIKNKLFSRYTKSYVFISDHDFKIPSKEITVYDYNTKMLKTLMTKAYDITIEGGSNSSASPTVYTKNSVDMASSKNISSVEENHTNIIWKVPSYMMLFLSFFVGGIIGLLLRPYLPLLKDIKFLKSKKRKVGLDEALLLLYPHMNESREAEKMVRLLYARQRGEEVEIDKEKLEYLVRYYRQKENVAPWERE